MQVPPLVARVEAAQEALALQPGQAALDGLDIALLAAGQRLLVLVEDAVVLVDAGHQLVEQRDVPGDEQPLLLQDLGPVGDAGKSLAVGVERRNFPAFGVYLSLHLALLSQRGIQLGPRGLTNNAALLFVPVKLW
ncbi:MAG: hypothetical protein JO250_10450 [Armatimonadetes bacterium]|nr:hypothetical protein [Armatimonadota bacterium]